MAGNSALETIRAARAHQRQMLREADRARHEAEGTLIMMSPIGVDYLLEARRLMDETDRKIRHAWLYGDWSA
jgi:hypothetical protein